MIDYGWPSPTIRPPSVGIGPSTTSNPVGAGQAITSNPGVTIPVDRSSYHPSSTQINHIIHLEQEVTTLEARIDARTDAEPNGYTLNAERRTTVKVLKIRIEELKNGRD